MILTASDPAPSPTRPGTSLPFDVPETLATFRYVRPDGGFSADIPAVAVDVWPITPGSTKVPYVRAASTDFREVLAEAAARARQSANLVGELVGQAQAVLQATDGAYWIVGLALAPGAKLVPAYVDGPRFAEFELRDVRVVTGANAVQAVVGTEFLDQPQ